MLAYLVVLAAGMTATMAPATDSIMSVVPANKAGVGSAVNDTTRELGGALGVAIIGSLASAGYADHMRDFFAGPGNATPDDIARTSTEQLGAAVGISQRLGDTGTSLADAAQTAFMNGWTSSLLLATTVALIAALATLALYPRRARQPAAVIDTQLDHSVSRVLDTADRPRADTARPIPAVRHQDRTPNAA